MPSEILTNAEKGEQFESYVINLITPKNQRFQLREWRVHRRTRNGLLPISALLPDLEIAFRRTNAFDSVFAIECKWRKQLYKQEMHWSHPAQIQRYQEYAQQRNIPVFVALGLGGLPSDPDEFFLAPLPKLGTPSLSIAELSRFKRPKRNKLYFNPDQLTLF